MTSDTPTAQPPAGATLTIGRRVFRVERDGDNYVLHGARGARYRTMRNAHTPHLMFLVNPTPGVYNAPRAWLTDRGGTLRVCGH